MDQERAIAMPGAAEFLNHVHSEGVAVFYITNRICDAASATDHTVAMLRKVHFPLAASQLLCRQNVNEPSTKSPRRAQVASTHRVLLLLGDDLNDFVAIPTRSPAGSTLGEERLRLVQANLDKWGTRWFMLPNPVYGSWERALGDSTKERLDALRP